MQKIHNNTEQESKNSCEWPREEMDTPSLLRINWVQIIISVASAALIAFGSSYFGSNMTLVRLEERAASMEKDVQRHEEQINREINHLESATVTLTARADDHERRLSYLERAFEDMGKSVSEIRGDVKALLMKSMSDKH